MKNFLFILGLLISFMLFAPEEGTKSMDEVMSATKEAVMKEKNTADAQRRFEVLSNELKSSNCLTPRRISQTTNNTIESQGHKFDPLTVQIRRLEMYDSQMSPLEKYGEIPSRHAFERSKSTS